MTLALAFFVCILLAINWYSVYSKLEAAVILPHGDVAYDPTMLPENSTSASHEAAKAIHMGATQIGEWLSHVVDPDVMFVSSPHGIALSHDFALYLGSSASGSAPIGQDLHDHNSSRKSYTVHLPTIQLAPALVQDFIDFVTTKPYSENVTGVIVPSDGSTDMPLHWAEVIPLLLIPRRQRNETQPAFSSTTLRRKLITFSSTLLRRKLIFIDNTDDECNHHSKCNDNDDDGHCHCSRKHMIWTHPLRRYDSSPAMVPELLHLGKLLRDFFDSRNEKVAVVISGDLSHTHQADGPYGYSNASALFDAAIGSWASSNNPCANAHDLLNTAAQLQPDAKSCGFTGLVLLHGMLCHGNDNNNEEWKSRVVVNRNATYFGMMAAKFFRS